VRLRRGEVGRRFAALKKNLLPMKKKRSGKKANARRRGEEKDAPGLRASKKNVKNGEGMGPRKGDGRINAVGVKTCDPMSTQQTKKKKHETKSPQPQRKGKKRKIKKIKQQEGKRLKVAQPSYGGRCGGVAKRAGQ